MLKIAIIDDHPVMLEGLKLLLKCTPDLNTSVVLCTDCPIVFTQQLEMQAIDIAILDIRLHGASGLELLRSIKSKYIDLNVLMYSSYYEPVLIETAIATGALGFLPKSADWEEMEKAIQKAGEGNYYIRDDYPESLLKKMTDKTRIKSPFDTPKSITAREKEVAMMIGKGLSYQAIADKLGISKRTVESYKDSFSSKTGIIKQVDIAKYCWYMGWG